MFYRRVRARSSGENRTIGVLTVIRKCRQHLTTSMRPCLESTCCSCHRMQFLPRRALLCRCFNPSLQHILRGRQRRPQTRVLLPDRRLPRGLGVLLLLLLLVVVNDSESGRRRKHAAVTPKMPAIFSVVHRPGSPCTTTTPAVIVSLCTGAVPRLSPCPASG